MYDVVEHGRRLYRSLVYSSDARLALATLPSAHPAVRTTKWSDGLKLIPPPFHALPPAQPTTTLQ